MAHSQLTATSIPLVSKLLSELITMLHRVQEAGAVLRPSVVSYVFFPLSTVMRRNTLSSIPDRILEKIFIAMNYLCESWWWDIDETTWEQIFMLCGAVLGGIDSKGKGKVRDDETKEAATRCLHTILRERSRNEDPIGVVVPPRCERIFAKFRSHASIKTFIPILGQTVNSLLQTAESPHLPLQRVSLELLCVLVEAYIPEDFVPSILPGVVSATSKIALGTGSHKGWTNGDIVSIALGVMQVAIVKSVGEDVCVRHGAVHSLGTLEDLIAQAGVSDVRSTSLNPTPSPYSTARTASWLRGTAAQLHIAMNALTPLVNHPTPSAALALGTFAEAVLSATTLTVPQSQGLLLTFLLSLSGSSYGNVADSASGALRRLLLPTSDARHSLLQTLLHISKDSLGSLPRLIVTQSDSKVEHLASLVESVCKLAMPQDHERHRINIIRTGVGKLLGPTGGVEKWGWSLLSVLQFGDAPITLTRTNGAQRLLETSDAVTSVPFPILTLSNVISRTAHAALERMFHAMGAAAGDDGLFAAEWFLGVGQNGRGPSAVAALWCACRLLEGAGGVSLDLSIPSTRSPTSTRSRRVEKLARGIAKRVAESWTDIDDDDVLEQHDNRLPDTEDDSLLVVHVKGLLTIRPTADSSPSQPSARPRPVDQILLHKVLSLQLLSVAAGILEARFSPLLLHTLYPILHSVVSDSPLVSTTGTATLNFVAAITSYASPANMLLSNFDYALDAVSRRLSRRWLDVAATKVLVALVRLVGRDVVQKAGDVVEECFDRLDEYHGYEVIVDGLIEVLSEVVKVVEEEEDHKAHTESRPLQSPPSPDNTRMEAFLDWFSHRHDQAEEEHESVRDSSYPREAWGKTPDAVGQQEPTEPIPEPTPSQALTKQIVSRSLYFLTHGAPTIRARILLVLSSAVPVLPESALLPSIHHAWPFILNRLSDQEPFVVSAAAALIESLAVHVGDFMHRRIWDDIWPRFRKMLEKLRVTDADSALARRGPGAVGTESAYTVSHRLYRSMLRTMTAAVVGVRGQDAALWDVIILFRRFLHRQTHAELQVCARELYTAISGSNEDAVWLALSATQGRLDTSLGFLSQLQWDVHENVCTILGMNRCTVIQL